MDIHCTTLFRIHCIQSRCMESTAFNRDAFYHAAWISLHSITRHGIHCIQSVCILISCMESIQSSCCMDSAAYSRDPLRHKAWNPLHSIGMHFTRLHGIHCIQSGWILPGCLESMHLSHCMDSTAYNRDPLRHNALNTLHSILLHGIHCIQSGCFGPCCIKSTAFNHAA